MIPIVIPKIPQTTNGNLLVFAGRRGRGISDGIFKASWLIELYRVLPKKSIFVSFRDFGPLWISIFVFCADFDII